MRGWWQENGWAGVREVVSIFAEPLTDAFGRGRARLRR